MFDLLAGNWELAVGKYVIPPELLGDLSPNYEEGDISAETQAGTISTPSGKPTTSEFTFTLFLPKKNAPRLLGYLWPEAYEEAANEDLAGRITFGSKACMERTPQKMNIHSICSKNSDTDMYIPAGISKIKFNPTLSTGDAASFEVTVYMQPDENGDRFRFGAGDLTKETIYDPTTGTWKDVPNIPTETTASRIAKINNK